MGESQSKQLHLSYPVKSKENSALKTNKNHIAKSPKLKAKFGYIHPINVSMEEIPEQQPACCVENSIKNFRSETSVMATQTCFSLIQVQQIKVRWNSFAKMKNRDYLTQYQILKKIGKGGFGVVSKVKSIHTQVIRAAKVVKKNDLKQNDHKKFLQQLSIMRSLDHPNIIKIYEVYDYKDEYTLIFQLCSGGQLHKKIKGKKTPQNIARNYMRQLVRTLIYLHSQGIVHRDLKPQNMLFENEGSDTLKIIDFGIAARIMQGQYLTDRIGTPYFIAPQVIYKQYNQKCDIWSAGVIFYMMLTGGLPFKAQNEILLLQNILREEPSFTGSIWSKYSPQCIQILKFMLQKKPDKRPSASQILNHKWFSMDELNTQIAEEQKGIQILQNIRKFNVLFEIKQFTNKLQAVVNTFIASQLLNNQQKSILVELFKELDLNNDGVISTEQLKQALQKKRKISNERVQLLMNIIDTNCSGQIQYTEFLVAGLSGDQFLKRQHFQKAFSYFDIDHSGTITYEEVVEFLQNYEQSEDQIHQMFRQVDANGDGQIDKQQFITLFITRTSQLRIFYNDSSNKQIAEPDITLKQKRKALMSQRDLNAFQFDIQ